MSDNQKLIKLIKSYQDLRLINWPEAVQMSDEFLAILFAMDVEDIFPRAVIRYLMNSGGWPLGVKVHNTENWSNVIEKFFGVITGGTKFIPDNYLEVTKSIIKDAFDYDIADPVKVEVEPKKTAKKTAKKTTEEGESGSKTFKSIQEMEEAEA